MAERDVELRLSLRDRQAVARGLRDTSGDLGDVASGAEDVSSAGDKAAGSLKAASSSRFARGFKAIGGGVRSLAGLLGRTLVGAAKAGAVGLGVTAVAAVGLSGKAINLASDAAEASSAFETVFGPAADKVGGNLDRLTDKFGVYNPELQDAARQFGVFAKAAGLPQKDLAKFSTSLTKAGLDLGSFYNADPGEVFQALQSGLSGEAEPLRRFGIFLSDATMKAEAASMGLTGTLTEQQKVMVRQRLIMKNLGDAQGDMARTAGGFANQQRAASGRVKEFTKLLGGPLSTAAGGALRGFNAIAKAGIGELTKRLPGLNSGAETLSQRFERWGNVIAKKLPGAIDTIISRWNSLKATLAGFSLSAPSADADGLGASFARLGSAIAELDWSKLGNGLRDAGADTISVFAVAVGFAADNIDTLAKYLPMLVVAYGAFKVAQTAANVAKLAEIPITVVQIGSNIALAAANRSLATQMALSNTTQTAATAARTGGTIATIRQTVATVASTVASKAASMATRVWAAGQWLLNAAMTANPIGLVIAGVAALVGGFVLLYKKSETFRNLINGLWNNVLKPFGKFLGEKLLGYIKLVAKAWLTMGQFGVRAFRTLLGAAFTVFEGILAAADKGLGWIPGLGGKISNAREAFSKFGDATINKLQGVEDSLGAAADKVDALGRKHATPTVTVSVRSRTDGTAPANKYASDIPARAAGGPVKAGQTYLVGEQGMELFRPKTDGTIIPNHDLPTPASNLRAAAAMPSIGMGEIADQLDSDASAISIGPAWTGGPITIQLVVDGKVLSESTLDDLDSRAARR